MDSIWTNGSWQVVTTSNDFLFHYFILSISLSLVLSYSSNGTQFISLSSIIDKVQRKGGPLINNRFQTTMRGPPLFFALRETFWPTTSGKSPVLEHQTLRFIKQSHGRRESSQAFLIHMSFFTAIVYLFIKNEIVPTGDQKRESG